jgi:hypothetical protein
MIAVWCRVAYTDACLEVEVEICIMSFCDDVVKGGIPGTGWMSVGWPRSLKPVMLLTCQRLSGYNSIGVIMLYAIIRSIS